MYCLNTNKLNGKIAERQTTKGGLACALGINRTTLFRRIKENSLQIKDVYKICEELKLSETEAMQIFFG